MKKFLTRLIFEPRSQLFLAAMLLLVATFLSRHNAFAFSRFVRSAMELTLIFILPAVGLSQIFASRLKNIRSWEFINLVVINCIVTLPLISLMLARLGNTKSGYLPYFAALVILLLSWFYHRHRKPYYPSVSNLTKSSLPFWVMLVIYIGITLILLLSYQTLPDLDPYYWLQHTNQFNQTTSLVTLPERPLFYFLVYIFTKAAHIDPFAFYKIVLPVISATALIPAWLFARTYENRFMQFAIMAIPLFIPSNILYQQMPMPQAIFIIAFYFFYFWLLYAARRKIDWPFYGAGIVIALAFAYHEIAILPFVAWLVVTIIYYRKQIWKYFLKNPIVPALLGLLVLSNANNGSLLYALSMQWLNILSPYFTSINPNVVFPARYINIDGNSMGWPGLGGVVKYYMFYTGPVVIILLAAAVIIAVRNHRRLKETLKKKEAQVIFFLFIGFFFISEILPRLLNLALLPERSWIFCGILATAAIPMIFSYWNRYRLLIPALVFLAAIISVGGAMYINYTKRYIVPDYQLTSAEWIRKNLPGDRIILASGNFNLLTFHAGSRTLLISPDFFCAASSQRDEMLAELLHIYMPNRVHLRRAAQASFLSQVTNYFNTATLLSIEAMHKMVDDNFASLVSAHNSISSEKAKPHVYVYFYRDDPRHPLLSRPYYEKASQEACKYHNFQKNSDMEMVYNDSNRVEIWRFK